MNPRLVPKPALGVALAASMFVWTSASRADPPTVVYAAPAPAAQPVVVIQQPAQATVMADRPVAYTGPDRPMLVSGLVLFGAPYVASVVVAGTSSHQGDHYLYLPVVGPWLDFAGRGSCGPGTATACSTETMNKVLLVGDGILQGIGAVSIVVALFTSERAPETRTVRTDPPKPTVRVTPTTVGRGSPGIAIVGSW